MTIRKWQYADNLSVYKIEKESFSDPWTKEMISDTFIQDNFIGYVAEEEGVLQGYIALTYCLDEAEINIIAVKREFRRKGIASKLLLTTFETLKKAGIKKNIMLTGDRETVAQSVAKTLGLDACYSQLLPADKVQAVENMLAQKPASQALVFVGDGINDAPVLARADVGIAMGAMGSDAAIEAADVVLMDDDPCKVALAIRIAKKCMNIVRQNVVFALGVKFLCMALGAVGIAGLPLAIFADVGVMVLAILNAIRCLRIKK